MSNHPVTSRSLNAPERVGDRTFATVRRVHWERIPVVLLGTFFLGLWWLVGGKYTIDGLPLLLNEIAAFFRVPVRLAPVTDWHWYLRLAWLPVFISVAERRFAPWRRLTFSSIMIWVLLVWLVVSGVDAGSTWLAVTRPPEDAYTVSKQLAAIKVLAALWSVATTFLPEAGIGALWWWLRRG